MEEIEVEQIMTQPKSADTCIIKLEKFDLDMANYLVASQDLISSEEKRRIKIIVKNRVKGHCYNANYKLGRRADATPMNGQEFCYIGRWCTTGGIGLQGLQHNIRAALATKFYFDVDMINAQPNMLLQICKREEWPCQALGKYCNQREKLFKKFEKENPVFTRNYCKTAIISLLFGGKPYNGNMPTWLTTTFYPELNQIMKNVSKLNPILYNKAKRSKPTNPLGCCCANYLQSEERKCLTALDQYLYMNGRYMGVLIHDGGYVEKKDGETEFPIELLRGAEQFILEKTGYLHNLATKDIITDFVVPNKKIVEMGHDYESIKKEFEKTHFKCIENASFYEVYPGTKKKVNIRSKPTLITSYEHMAYEEMNKKGEWEEQQFIYKWIKDPKLRKYESVKLMPPPVIIEENCYNLWEGFAMSGIQKETEAVDDFLILLEHIKLLVGEECYDYFLKWLALLFQQPSTKPNVCILIKSMQGLGKGFLFSILSKMIGEKYCFITENIKRDVFGDFNHLIEGKLLLGLDEMNLGLSTTFSEAIKGIITNPELTINPKKITPYQVTNLTHIMVFTNNEWPWKMDASDRRCLPIDRYHVQVPTKEYFDRLDKAHQNNSALRELYNYLLLIDISNFDFKNDRPETSFTNDLKEISRPLELQYFIHLIQSYDNDFTITAKELFMGFQSYLIENFMRLSYGTSNIKLSLKLQNLKIPGVVKNRRKEGIYYDFNKTLAHEWIVKNKYCEESLLDK